MFSLIADDEVFVDVKGYEGRYSVSNYGRVYSNRPKREKFIQPSITTGYFRVCLYKDNKQKNIFIHNLVGDAFIGKRENGLTFDHIDRNRQNNKASNLRLATRSEQCVNRNIFKNSKTREKNIFMWIDNRDGYKYYQIQIKRNKKIVFQKRLSSNKFSLEDAKKIRDDFLNTI